MRVNDVFEEVAEVVLSLKEDHELRLTSPTPTIEELRRLA